MQVILIGSGNVATVLGRIISKAGNEIIQIISRNKLSASLLADELKASSETEIEKINLNADLYIIAVKDDAVHQVAHSLKLKDKLVVHTAGSVSKKILQTTGSTFGVIWPMAMIRKTMVTLSNATIVIDGNTNEVISELKSFASSLSTTVMYADDDTRMKMHMIASVTSNFTNHLYHLAADYCAKENIDFSNFYSIIEETAKRIQTIHPQQAQAGPAFRGDFLTIEKHFKLLENYPEIEKIYSCLSESIMAVK
jgi:predicted short-subunit dehydrogenase-like oxidoreductase (DUF2520 family)